MAYTTTCLLALALATPILAQQSSILSLPFYGYDNQPVVASVVAANSAATTLALACREGTDGSDCGLFPAQTLTVGPSTYNMFMGEGTAFTGTQMCSTQGTTGAVCTESAGGSGANFPGSSTTTYEGTDVAVFGVTVTAGVERLGAGGSGSGSGSASTGSAGSSSPASTSATATSTREVTVLTGTASSSSASRSGSESSSSSGTATGSAAATSSSSAASADVRISGGLVSFLVAAVGTVGYCLT